MACVYECRRRNFGLPTCAILSVRAPAIVVRVKCLCELCLDLCCVAEVAEVVAEVVAELAELAEVVEVAVNLHGVACNRV